jgi:hypothetical protein
MSIVFHAVLAGFMTLRARGSIQSGCNKNKEFIEIYQLQSYSVINEKVFIIHSPGIIV